MARDLVLALDLGTTGVRARVAEHWARLVRERALPSAAAAPRDAEDAA